VEDPHDPAELGPVLALAAGGVATSTPAARRWHSGGVDRHHLFSPATGAPSDVPVASVTVAAATAAWAEALTKVPFGRGALEGVAILQDMDVAALVVCRDRARHATAAWSRLGRDQESA
jgi:thiamine biosynthesis lipoprotein ApbE